jgi:hypothetical protein
MRSRLLQQIVGCLSTLPRRISIWSILILVSPCLYYQSYFSVSDLRFQQLRDTISLQIARIKLANKMNYHIFAFWALFYYASPIPVKVVRCVESWRFDDENCVQSSGLLQAESKSGGELVQLLWQIVLCSKENIKTTLHPHTAIDTDRPSFYRMCWGLFLWLWF